MGGESSDAAREWSERALERHGGRARWEALEAIELDVEHLSGVIPWFKGLGASYPMVGRVRVSPRARRVVFLDYPAPGVRTVFDAGNVATIPADAPAVVPPGNHRQRFAGLRKLRRWSPEDAAYFFGYALSHYLGLPFSLLELPAERRVMTVRAGHALPFVIRARYEPDEHTHSRVERFYFDETGLLRRHDYHAEIIGPGMTGAHFSDEYTSVDGLMIAQRREVYARLGTWVSPVIVLRGRLRPRGS